ncbi:MAG TPA: beta-ketoacyl synthase N-terminal-like domain-containing protein [Candidatus Ozemobacteraceae bacterium]
MNQTAVITGIGVVTPYGNGCDALVRGLNSSRPAYGPITAFDASTWPVRTGGWVPDAGADALPRFHNKLRGMDKYVRLGVLAAQSAIRDSGLEPGAVPPHRFGAFVSSGTNGHNAEGLFAAFDQARGADNQLDLGKLSADGLDRIHPWWLLGTISNNLIFFVTHFLRLEGANSNVCNSAAGGAAMLSRAVEAVNSGEVDAALVGGADATLNWQLISDLSRLGLLAHGDPRDVAPLRPFTAGAPGTVLSEAAVFLVLERASDAASRGRSPLAAIHRTASHGSFRDPIHPAPDGHETTLVMDRLLSAVAAADDGPVSLLVNAAGTGLERWDASELAGLEAAARAHPGITCLLGSSKPMLGHAFSASFLLETAATVLAMRGACPIALPVQPELPGTILAAAPPSPGRHSWAVNLEHCFGGNTAGVLLHVA